MIDQIIMYMDTLILNIIILKELFWLWYIFSIIIENTFANIKDKIKRIYLQIPNKNFLLFLREAEWRRNMATKNKDYKSKDLFEIFEYISNTSYSLYNID